MSNISSECNYSKLNAKKKSQFQKNRQKQNKSTIQQRTNNSLHILLKPSVSELPHSSKNYEKKNYFINSKNSHYSTGILQQYNGLNCKNDLLHNYLKSLKVKNNKLALLSTVSNSINLTLNKINQNIHILTAKRLSKITTKIILGAAFTATSSLFGVEAFPSIFENDFEEEIKRSKMGTKERSGQINENDRLYYYGKSGSVSNQQPLVHTFGTHESCARICPRPCTAQELEDLAMMQRWICPTKVDIKFSYQCYKLENKY